VAHTNCQVYAFRTPTSLHVPINVLIVDDDTNSGEALTAYLASRGANARYVDNGRAALEMMKSWPVDVAVLDISMPEMDGFAIARMVRSLPMGRDISLIAHTALPESFVEERAIVSGFDAYCQKGNSLDSLLQILETTTHQRLEH
jgi:CheY-like chemotaxis protein